MKYAIRKIIVIFFSLSQLILPFLKTTPVFDDKNYTKWSANDEFKLEDTATLTKQAGKDFVILNLTDIQLTDREVFFKTGDFAADVIKKLVDETKPDLITLTGDNAWGTYSYVALCDYMGSLGVPWAAVMGNHDQKPSYGYLLANADNSLYRFGSKEMGLGNYAVNIIQDGKPIHTLYMMDTHDGNTFTKDDGSTVSGYDHLWKPQLDWYRWNVQGVNRVAGRTVQSTVFFHIPVVEYVNAWNEAWNEGTKSWNSGFEGSFGTKREAQCPAPVNNGFFALCKELGSTKDIVCGHDHINDYSIVYDGIRLTYGLKTGSGAYWNPDLCGGTTITVHDDGTTTTKHIFVTAEELGYNSADFKLS